MNDKKNPLKYFDLQMFGDGGSDGDDGKGGGSDDVIEVKDPHTGDMVKIPKQLENFVNHLISGTRGTVKKELQTKYDELMTEVTKKLREKETENKDILTKLEELENQNLSATEIAKKEFSKNMSEANKKVENLTNERDYWKSQYQQHRILGDLRSSFGSTKLCNPEQVVFLLKEEGKAQLREMIDDNGEKTGKYETIITVNIADKDGNLTEMAGTPDKIFDKWIAQPKNAHHLLNNLNPGGNSNNSGRGADGKIDPSMLKDLNPVEKLKLARQIK